ncbi:hypothetical protein AYL99_02668 [Fonsecaea erecta]|uniref:Uncharacterized protein n=1 Tax=Fonsecaea erecta TaxID=1367422 RepID=A0A178ZVF4_9EURO|nr:hypothetical protein AYL99_02668 [Fonsecaea erecta]OAP63441.1 hypothetical protein AYL99_02668 [Fonsecaea erecta]
MAENADDVVTLEWANVSGQPSAPVLHEWSGSRMAAESMEITPGTVVKEAGLCLGAHLERCRPRNIHSVLPVVTAAIWAPMDQTSDHKAEGLVVLDKNNGKSEAGREWLVEEDVDEHIPAGTGSRDREMDDSFAGMSPTSSEGEFLPGFVPGYTHPS